MPVTNNGWEDFFPDLVERIKAVFQSNQNQIIENAEQNITEVLPLSDEDKASIRSEYEIAVDRTVEKTVNDINDSLNEEGSEVQDSTISLAKVVGGFFLINTLSRAYERLHGATIARQTQDDVDEAQRKAIEISENQIEIVARNELGQTYSTTAREQHLGKGVTTFTWIHSGADHPRQNHLSFNGSAFSWESPPDTDGFPGEAFNCACYAVPTTNEQNSNRNKIMSRNIFNMQTHENISDIYITGVIGDIDVFNDEGVIFSQFKEQLNTALSSDKVRIYINSEGGYVFDGIAIYNHIKELSKNNAIEIHIAGIAASAASIIALAVPVENRFIHPGSIVMIHNPWSCLCGEADELANEATTLSVISDSLARIYADETNLTLDEARALMKAETYFSSDEAVEKGFANLASSTTQAKADKLKIKAFVDSMKSCSVEQKHTIKNSRQYQPLVKPLEKPLNQVLDMTLEELQAENEKLKGQVNDLTTEKTTEQAKLTAAETRLVEVESEKTTIQANLDNANGKIDAAEQGALEKVKKDFELAAQARVRAEKAGFEEVNGDTVEQVQRAVLAKANIEKPDSFEGDSLNQIFNYVLKIHEDDDEHDSAFNKLNKVNKADKTQKQIRPTRRGAK